MWRLLQLPIVVPPKVDDDDGPVPEIRLHVGGEARSPKVLVAAPRAGVIERRGVLEHVGDDDEGLAASVVGLLRPGNELERLENRRLLADLRGQALFERGGDRDQKSLVKVLRDLATVFVEVMAMRGRAAQVRARTQARAAPGFEGRLAECEQRDARTHGEFRVVGDVVLDEAEGEWSRSLGQ